MIVTDTIVLTTAKITVWMNLNAFWDEHTATAMIP